MGGHDHGSHHAEHHHRAHHPRREHFVSRCDFTHRCDAPYQPYGPARVRCADPVSPLPFGASIERANFEAPRHVTPSHDAPRCDDRLPDRADDDRRADAGHALSKDDPRRAPRLADVNPTKPGDDAPARTRVEQVYLLAIPMSRGMTLDVFA